MLEDDVIAFDDEGKCGCLAQVALLKKHGLAALKLLME